MPVLRVSVLQKGATQPKWITGPADLKVVCKSVRGEPTGKTANTIRGRQMKTFSCNVKKAHFQRPSLGTGKYRQNLERERKRERETDRQAECARSLGPQSHIGCFLSFLVAVPRRE